MAYSCHIIIKLAPESQTPPTHRVAIEETLGISPTYVSSFFRSVLGTATYTSNDKRGNEIEAVCTSDLKGHPSESVEAAMHHGVIRQVHLIKPGEIEEYDSEHIVPGNVMQALKIKGRGQAVMNAIRTVWNKNKDDWEQMRVTVVSENKKSRIVNVERDQDAAQALFVKSEFVVLSEKIDVCCEEIHEGLVTKAKILLGI